MVLSVSWTASRPRTNKRTFATGGMANLSDNEGVLNARSSCWSLEASSWKAGRLCRATKASMLDVVADIESLRT